MDHQVRHGPAFAMLELTLGAGETITAEAGSMVARDSGVAMEVRLNAGHRGGVWAGFKAFVIALIRRVVGGETFFVNVFSGPGKVWLAPHLAGQISHRRLAGETLVISAGAFLASTGALDMKLRFGGLRGLLAKEGLFMLEVSGEGELWFNSYGGVTEIDVTTSFVVDNGHLVGFEGQLAYDIRMPGGGMMGLFASGEGLVCEFRGTGKVYLQSRNVSSLVGWIGPYLP